MASPKFPLPKWGQVRGNCFRSKWELLVYKPWARKFIRFRSSRVQNLGIIIDQHLKFDRHISSVIGSSFYQLRLLSKIKNFLTPKTLEMAVHAFVTTRLDYCNSLYCGISKSQIARLQLVQNAAARLLLNCRKHEHITPILRSLHWLPILSENRL